MIFKEININMPNWDNLTNYIESYISWDLKRHSLEWLSVALNYSIINEYKNIHNVINILINWIEKNNIGFNENLSKMTWNDHSASSRINVIIMFYFKLQNTKYLNYNLKKNLIKSLIVHGEFIYDYLIKNINSLSNHIYIASRALLFLSLYFKKFIKDYNIWLNLSLNIINKYFDKTFVDGINIESSPAYQFYLLLDYTRMIYILNLNGYNTLISQKNIQDLEKIFNATKFFLRNYIDKKTIPMIGDSPLELDFISSIYELDDINKMMRLIFNNSKMNLFSVENKFLINKDCGFILINKNDENVYNQIIFRTKPKYKTFHTQNDVNSFNYYYNGLDWFTDT